MNRGSFLRNLFGAAVAAAIAPALKVIPIIQAKSILSPTATLFADLNLLVPEWYPRMVEKYGSESYEPLLISSIPEK